MLTLNRGCAKARCFYLHRRVDGHLDRRALRILCADIAMGVVAAVYAAAS